MREEQGAFSIPAIDKERCAMGQYLGMDSMNTDDSELPVRIGEVNGVHTFEHNGERFQLGHHTRMKGCKAFMFNSNLWGVKRLSCSS